MAKLQELLGARLAGGFVGAARPPGVYVDLGWKEAAVLDLAGRYADARIAWVDDEAVANAIRWGELPRLLPAERVHLVAPEPRRGLTAGEARRVAAFLGRELSGR